MTTIAPTMLDTRRALSKRFLAGSGIEIGALDSPLQVPANAHVRYVDRVSVARLREYYPELRERQLVEPDVIEDGEVLPGIASGSLDFVIANHMLEHCENPLGTLRTHLDRIRRGGTLFYAIPDKRQCFDRARPLTAFEHLVADDADGGMQSRQDHYLEWAIHVNGLADIDAARHNAAENMRNAYSIHFHVWDPPAFRNLLCSAGAYLQIPYAIEHFQENGTEVIAVLKKQ